MFSVRNTTILLTAIAGIGLAQGCSEQARNSAQANGEKFESSAEHVGAKVYDTTYEAVNISSRQGDSAVRESAEVTTADAAMEKRQWPESISYIPNGSTVAGPTGFAYEPRRDQNQYKFYYADTGNFFLNLVTMPFTFWNTPPLSEQTYPGERFNPTYTAVPPLPPEKVAEPLEPTPAPSEAPAPSAETPAPNETPAPPVEMPAPQQPAPEQPAPPTTQP